MTVTSNFFLLLFVVTSTAISLSSEYRDLIDIVPMVRGLNVKAYEEVWQDREVRFDSPPGQMHCRKGEVAIDSINSVEDTKGNNGEKGEAPHRSKALNSSGKFILYRQCSIFIFRFSPLDSP